MKLAIIGSRTFNNYNLLCSTLDKVKGTIDTIISGAAAGADTLGAKYAREKGIQLTEFPAEWSIYGKSAGYRRNKDIINNSDAVVAFWDGISLGTKHSINLAQQKGIPVVIVMYTENPIRIYCMKSRICITMQ